MLVSQIKPNPNNPRICRDAKFKLLVKSIQEFPEMLNLRPIVIDETNMILGGNQRFRACIEAGLTSFMNRTSLAGPLALLSSSKPKSSMYEPLG